MADPDHDKLFAAATVGVIEALVKFRQDITKALNQDPTLPLSPEHERELYAAVLIAAGQFVATTIDRGIANRYFFELQSALVDLNEGTVRPLLKPSPQHNRPPDPSNEWRPCARRTGPRRLHAFRTQSKRCDRQDSKKPLRPSQARRGKGRRFCHDENSARGGSRISRRWNCLNKASTVSVGCTRPAISMD
jgi:hypothetical protein